MSLLSLRRAVVRRIPNAEVAELADAHGSGPCARKGVGVRVPSSAPSFLVASLPNRWRACKSERFQSSTHGRRGTRVGPLHSLRERTFSAPLYCSQLLV